MSQAQSIIPYVVSYRPIDDLPGYEVGDDGEVWSCWSRGGHTALLTKTWHRIKSRPVKARPNAPPYLQVKVVRNGKNVCRFVHVLVLTAFAGPCPEGQQCRHLDGISTHNWIGNLVWGTPRENYEDAIRHGTAIMGRRGEAHCRVKLTRSQVEEIIKIRKVEGLGQRMICRRLGLPAAMRGAVLAVIRGSSWNHVTGFPRYRPQTK